MRSLVVAAAVILHAACSSAGAMLDAGGRVLPSRPTLRREDRVVISTFNNVTGVAASDRMVFVSSPEGLAMFDFVFSSWLPPLTPADGYPAGPVTAMAADPLEEGVWIALPGALLYYRARVDYLTTAVVPGSIREIWFDTRNIGAGAYVTTAGGEIWLVSRQGFVSMISDGEMPPGGSRITTADLADLHRMYPGLQSFQGLLTRDDQLQSWPVSAGSKSPSRNDVWLGTRGNGLYRIDPAFNQAEHFPFGLLDRGAGALAMAADGIWVAGLGTAAYSRGGLTFATSDLQRWRWLEGPLTRPLLGARTYALNVRAQTAWVGTDRGLARMDTRNDNDVRMWSLADGLPSDQAIALATTANGTFVGTPLGLVFVADTAGTPRGRGAVSPTIASGIAIRALLAAGDTLWIGSDAGLLLLPVRRLEQSPRRPAAAATESRLARPIHAISHSDTVVAVATRDELFQFDLRTGQLLPRLHALDLSALRGVTGMAMDGRTIWLAGYGGILAIHRGSGVQRFYSAPGEVPGEAFDVRLQDEFVWVATRGGLLRLRRLSDGMVP